MRIATLGLLLGLLACASADPDGSGPRPVPDRSVPVTAQDLWLRDDLWPFRVELREPVTPAGESEPLAPMPGVLVRVQPGGVARIDFARFGRHEVPVAATDLVERANRIRLGSESKLGPNLVLTIGNKLLDSKREEVHPFPLPVDAPVHALLCVFADPDAQDFPPVAASLRPLADREGVQTVLFPVSALRDGRVRQRLRANHWTVPFVMDRFSRLYTRSILGEDVPLPHVLLLTPDGRLLAGGPVTDGLAARIDAALSERLRVAGGR